MFKTPFQGHAHMYKRTISTISLILLGIVCILTMGAQSAPKEFRGIWVITWEIYAPSGTILKQEKLKKRIETILDNVKLAGLNAVLWQVRQNGTVYYPAKNEPWGKYLEYKDPGFDPVEFALEQAHKRGLEFHAWFNTFEAFDRNVSTVSVRHPEWIARDKENKPMPKLTCLSPGIPKVREYLVKVVSEFVSKYQTDGIHMDYIRWNEYRWSDMENPLERNLVDSGFGEFLFDREHPYEHGIPQGFSTWESWRRDAVTKFVASLGKAIKLIRPTVRLSVAAIGKYNWGIWNGYHAVFQDAALWLNQGLIDQIMAMNYAWTDAVKMYDGLAGKCPECWLDFITQGLERGGQFSAGIGSMTLDNRDLWENHGEIVKSVRSAQFTSGFQFFSYGAWEKKNYFSRAKDELGLD